MASPTQKFAVLLLLMFGSNLACASTITVNSNADLPAANAGDGVCEATSGLGNCTLRAAIMEANQIAGPVEIILPAGDYVLSLGQLIADGQITIRGSGAPVTRIDANALSRVLTNNNLLVLQDLTIRGGRSLDSSDPRGGGLLSFADMSLSRVIVEDNVANLGGGLQQSSGSLEVVDSTFRNNALQAASPTAFQAGGMAIKGNNAQIIIRRSSFYNNLDYPEVGGFIGTIRSVGGELRILNSTISNNARGGVNAQNGALDLRFSTLADNPGGNLLNFSFDGSHPTVLAANVLSNTGFGPNCLGTAGARTSLGHNVASDSICALNATADIENVDAQLGPLRDNGGPTQTLALGADSPAVNRVPPAACVDWSGIALDTDQRGRARPIGGACDSGAVEFDPGDELIFSDRFEP